MALSLTGAFFWAASIAWCLSLLLEIRKGRNDLWPIIAGVLFFGGSNFGFHYVLRTYPSFLHRVPRGSTDFFVNTAISLLHSTLVSFSVLSLLSMEWCRDGISNMLTHEELFSGIWPGSYMLLCVSSGYFAYDQWDMLHKHLYSPSAPSLLFHHLVLLICFTTALYRRVTINYLVLTLVCEVHSIFLHWRRVTKMAGFREKGGKLISLEWSLNWATFIFARIFVHIWITMKLLTDASKFPSGVELPLALAGMAGLNLLNVILGLDLVKAFRKERNEGIMRSQRNKLQD